LKRLFDLCLAIPLGIVLALPMLGVALLVRLTSMGPALYWSDRVGRDNSIFRMPKFRSMRIETPDVAAHLLVDPGTHLTSIGGFLRKASLDELPQLWSILKGDMSFVGPRPALFNQEDLIEKRTRCGVHLLIPGLTGLAQLGSRGIDFDGSDALEMSAKVALDREYLERRTFWLDLTILTRTAGLFLRKS
jgi:O-antigen biosynthesis protein WbqP